MNNKELFIDGYLNRLAKKYSQFKDEKRAKDDVFEIFSIATILDKPFQEVFDTIRVLGDKDGGIDGICFEDKGDYYVMHVFQCKNKPSLKANEIDKFRNDFNDIFPNANKIGKQNIEDLQPWIDEYKQISDQGIIIESKLYFVFNGQKKDEHYANNQAITDTYHNPDNDFYIIDNNDLYHKISNLTLQKRNTIKFTFHPERSNVSLLDSQGLYTYAIQNIRAANFRINALELCQLMDLEKSVNGSIDSLFEENIRSYLGVKVRANKNMNETLNNREDAIYFPFLNNGITLICKELTIPSGLQNDSYLVPVINPQIVNGLQTSWVLYTNYRRNPQSLKDVFVNIRIYETKDKALIEKITDATNNQTPINYRDKISTKDFNLLTKAVFSNIGVRYITKRGETFSRDNKDYIDEIDSETILKFWYASFFEQPHTAKNSIASVLQTIFDASTVEKHPLESLFNGSQESPIYKQLLSVYRIYNYVQRNKKISSKNNNNLPVFDDSIGYREFLLYADELMSYGIYKYIGTQLDNYNDDVLLKKAYQDSFITIDKIIERDKEAHKKVAKTFSFNAYFKKPKCKVDFDSEKSLIESDTLFEDIKNIR